MGQIKATVSLCKLFKSLFLYGLIFFVKAGYSEPSLTMLIDSSEGGEISDKRRQQLKLYLNSKQCNVQTIQFTNEGQLNTKHHLIFKPLSDKLSSEYQQQLSIKVLDNTPLSASVMVRNSTAIESLESLGDIRIAFLSEESELGYRLPKELFNQAGVNHSKHQITFTQSNLAAVSLLMHKDVFAAVIATPLAKKWATSNNLKTVRKTKELASGGIWFHNNLSIPQADFCSQAFRSLNQSNRQSKKILKVFPGWLESFVISSTEVHSKPLPKNSNSFQ